MTIRKKLSAVLIAISLLLIGLCIWQGSRVMRDLTEVQRGETINQISAGLISAAQNLAIERGQSNGALGNSQPASPVAISAIKSARSKADEFLNSAIGATTGLSHAPAVEEKLQATRRQIAALNNLRRTAEAEMAKPLDQRDKELAPRLFRQLTELIETSQLFRRALEEDMDSARLDLKRLQAISHLSWSVSEFLGRERGYISGLIASGAKIGPEQATTLAGFRARIDLLWPELELMVAMMSAEQKLAASFQDARTVILDRFGVTRQAVVAAGASGQPYGMTAQQWFAEATKAIDASLALSALAGERADSLAHGLTLTGTFSLGAAVSIGIVALALIVITFLVANRQILSPIAAMTDCMRILAKGDYSIDVAGLGRRDEIGEMANAVQVFKDNGLENERLRQRVEEERQQRERERAEQEAILDRSVGEVVAAAVAGDLSRRIQTQSLDGVMRKLGDEMNSLLATVSEAIDEVSEVVAGIARGDLTRRVHGKYRGVFAVLRDNINRASETLGGTVRGITQATETVSNASAEISTGSQDLAQRTESQAASIEQTAASMHEITATVKQNADNAQAANQLATAARATAERGGQVVGEAVAAVSRIEDSARKISDIVGLIDEIAFQTNLLALNASVEAARAGEAGKGFAVVAQEVRALAQRSANASKDIKMLIAESNAQVQSGAGLVSQTGNSLTEIVSAVKKVSDIVAEIAAASREQATGLEQINTAVATMDEMTQRNGALVEETTAAAQSLNQQAQELAQLVQQFRVS